MLGLMSLPAILLRGLVVQLIVVTAQNKHAYGVFFHSENGILGGGGWDI